MSSLTILTWIAAGFAAFALLLWVGLLVYRVKDNRRMAEREKVRQRWLGELLDRLDDPSNLASLPKVQTKREMEDVLGLLRDLAERFRGQIRDSLGKVLAHIGAEEYALSLLDRARATQRVRACALLAWIGASDTSNARLKAALADPAPNVRLEAAHALAMRREGTVPEVLDALRGTPALHSARVRDIVRQLAPGHSREMSRSLSMTHNPREMELLLEGLAASGDLAEGLLIASHLDDPHAAVRIAAVRALEQLADPAFQPNVIDLAHDPDPKVRTAVAKYFESMAQPTDANSTLEFLAVTPDFEVQRIAVHALVKLNGQRLQNFRETKHDPLVEALIEEATHQASMSAPTKS